MHPAALPSRVEVLAVGRSGTENFLIAYLASYDARAENRTSLENCSTLLLEPRGQALYFQRAFVAAHCAKGLCCCNVTVPSLRKD